MSKKELEFHGISMQDQGKFVKCVVGIKNLCDYNPFEVVEKFVNIREAEGWIEVYSVKEK